MKYWVAFFSQTGSEINNIRKKIKRNPDLIIVNKTDMSKVNKELIEDCGNKIISIPDKPSLETYLTIINHSLLKYIFNNCFITLNGYLRIIPKEICEKFDIYNLHPGLITKYPELKGFNPQEKAYKMKLSTSGSVIHRVTPEVDSGEILSSVEVNIKDKSLDEIYETLHEASTQLWVKFFKENLL